MNGANGSGSGKENGNDGWLSTRDKKKTSEPAPRQSSSRSLSLSFVSNSTPPADLNLRQSSMSEYLARQAPTTPPQDIPSVWNRPDTAFRSLQNTDDERNRHYLMSPSYPRREADDIAQRSTCAFRENRFCGNSQESGNQQNGVLRIFGPGPGDTPYKDFYEKNKLAKDLSPVGCIRCNGKQSQAGFMRSDLGEDRRLRDENISDPNLSNPSQKCFCKSRRLEKRKLRRGLTVRNVLTIRDRIRSQRRLENKARLTEILKNSEDILRIDIDQSRAYQISSESGGAACQDFSGQNNSLDNSRNVSDRNLPSNSNSEECPRRLLRGRYGLILIDNSESPRNRVHSENSREISMLNSFKTIQISSPSHMSESLSEHTIQTEASTSPAAGSPFPTSPAAGSTFPTSPAAGSTFPTSPAAGSTFPTSPAAGSTFPTSPAAGSTFLPLPIDPINMIPINLDYEYTSPMDPAEMSNHANTEELQTSTNILRNRRVIETEDPHFDSRVPSVPYFDSRNSTDILRTQSNCMESSGFETPGNEPVISVPFGFTLDMLRSSSSEEELSLYDDDEHFNFTFT